MLELTQVAEIVTGRQSLLTGPRPRLADLAPREVDPRPQRRDRPHVREEVADVEAFGLAEQFERPVQVALGLPQPGRCRPPAVAVLRQPVPLAKVAALPQVLRSGPQLATRAADLAQRHVHVRHAPHNRSGLTAREPQRPPAGTPGLGEPALLDPDVRQRDRAPEHVADVAGPLQPGAALGPRPVGPVQVAARPDTSASKPDAAELSSGHTNRDISQTLHLSVRTVEKHVERLIMKTGRSRSELARLAESITDKPAV